MALPLSKERTRVGSCHTQQRLNGDECVAAAREGGMKCISCEKRNPHSGRFCTGCGAELPCACTACGTVNAPGSNYCGRCGADLRRRAPDQPLSDDGPAAAPRSSPGSGPERRHVTVVFSDIVGSTALTKLLDPEDLNNLNQAYYALCEDAVRDFDGMVARKSGDGVMAVFGYPRAHEDDAERAIHAALRIVECLQNLRRSGQDQVRARVAVATGWVVVDEYGPDEMVGEAPNLASHLQAAAEPNTVLVSDSTRQLVGAVFRFERLNRTLKGKSVTAWRVIGEKLVPSRFAAHVGSLTSFVGRDQEVALLNDRWEQAKQGEGQVVLLSGEAGIGKSRIVETFRYQAEKSCVSLQYQCSPYHVNSPFHPIIGQVAYAAGIDPDDGPAVKLAKLESFLNPSSSRAEEIIPIMAALLLIPTDERYPPPDPDPQRRKERTIGALIDHLTGLAQQQPVLMILEDAHWADPTSLDLFGRFILQLAQMRVLLIVTYRPDFTVPFVPHPRATALLLNRLGRRHCQEMIGSITRGKMLPAMVMQLIVDKTDGVPLFVEELTKTVLESELLKEQNNAWVLSGPLPALAIPATLQDSLMARLDRLPDVKEVAQIGAAIGREFPYPLILAVAPLSETSLQQALAKLTAAGLVFSHGAPPAATYVFKHALVQDAAYETLLRSKRKQLHAQIAAALEARFPEVAETQPEVIAHHYTQAGRTEAAVEWWKKAGDLAIHQSANTEAVQHLSRAIELLESVPESRERDTNELAIRIALSGPLIATRGYVTSELADNYARAWDLCSKLSENKSIFPVMYGQWVIPYVRGDMGAALKNAERFLRQAEQQEDDGLLLMGHRIYGSSLVWRGDTLPGSEHLQRALDLYHPAHDRLAYMFSQHPRTAALAHLCLALQHLGRPDQAMAAGWEALSQAKRIEHFNSIAYSLCFVSLMIMLRRDVETLRKTAGELIDLSERHNASYWALWARPMLGWIKAQEGDVESGVLQMHESTEALSNQKANLWVPQTLLLEAEILGQAGHYRRAYRLLDDAQALIEPLDQRFYEAELHRVRGVVMLAEDACCEAAIASLDRAIEVARRQNSRFLELRAAVSKSRHWLDRGRREEARAMLEPAYRSFSEGLDTADLVEAKELLDAI
jgi:class 3 adenylate cyclase/predicted ATPase